MRFLRQSLVGIPLVSMTLALLVLAAQTVGTAIRTRMAGDQAGPPQRERVFTVSVMTAREGEETPVLNAFGQVESDIAQLRCPELIRILQPIRRPHTPDIAHNRIPLPGLPRSKMRQHQRMKRLIRQKLARMARAALRLAKE